MRPPLRLWHETCTGAPWAPHTRTTAGPRCGSRPRTMLAHSPPLAVAPCREARIRRDAGRSGRCGALPRLRRCCTPGRRSCFFLSALPWALRPGFPAHTPARRAQVLACSTKDDKGASGLSPEELAQCTCAPQILRLPPPLAPVHRSPAAPSCRPGAGDVRDGPSCGAGDVWGGDGVLHGGGGQAAGQAVRRGAWGRLSRSPGASPRRALQRGPSPGQLPARAGPMTLMPRFPTAHRAWPPRATLMSIGSGCRRR